MRLWRSAFVLAAMSGLTLGAPIAHATSVTLGPPELESTNSYFLCEGLQENCPLGFTVAAIHPSGSSVAPANGVVIGWAMEGQGGVELRVIEAAPGGGYHGVATSAPADNDKGLRNQTELPIKAGDLIGADVLPHSHLNFILNTKSGYVPGSELYDWPDRPLGEGAGEIPTEQLPYELQLQAYVELTPVVSSVSPASGTTAGGGTVTITGKYLDSALYVKFGSTLSPRTSVDPSGEQMTATVPASAPGTVDVRVGAIYSVSEATAADMYTFVAPAATSSTSSSTPSGSGSQPSGIPGSASQPGSKGASSGTPGTTAATLAAASFSESASRWRLGSALPHVSSAPVGTVFSFSLNEPGSVTLSFARTVTGRRTRGRCVAQSHANRGKPKCKRSVLVGALSIAGHSGVNTVRFQGNLTRSKRLQPGSYTATVTTSDGHAAKPLTHALSFTVLP